jgi:hypothetical protein
MRAGGVAIGSDRELLPKSRRQGRGGVYASCQKIAEMMGESGVVVSYDGMQGNGRDEGRGCSVASYRELPGGGRDEGRGRHCR